MKKHFTLFFIYAAVIIAGLCLFLIFYNKKEDNSTSSQLKQEITNKEEDKETLGDGEVDNTIYATKLTLNCARTIDIKPNNSVEIIGSYLTIEPANVNLTITITAERGDQEDLTFKNNIITAKSEGKYRIKFSAPKTKTSELSDTLVVTVKEEVSSYIIANLSTLTLGESKNIDEIFTFDNVITNKIIQTDSNLLLSNNSINALNVGESAITILYDIGMFRFTYSLFLTIKDIPLYKIIAVSVSSNAEMTGNIINCVCNKGDILYIQYEVRNRDEEYVFQLLEKSLDNNTIATCEIADPFIIVTCENKGSVNLIISCVEDSESFLTLTINFN